MSELKNPRKQRKPSVGRGGVPTPPGFEAHPERRHNGAWKKEDTPRYKLEKMMTLSESEIKDIVNNPKASLFERKLATCIGRGNWREIEGMINQVYGKPREEVTVRRGKPEESLSDAELDEAIFG